MINLILLSFASVNLTAFSSDKTLSVYIDCKKYCDADYIKTQIGFVNFITEIDDADVYIMIDYIQTASGGYEYHINFNGQKQFETKDSELIFYTPLNATHDAVRNKICKYLKIGLIDYLKSTPIIERIDVEYKNADFEEDKPAISTNVWKNWVFSTSLGLSLTSDNNYKSKYLHSNITASNTTPDKEILFSYYKYFSKNKYKLSHGYYESEMKSDFFSFTYKTKVYKKWGVGFFNTMRRATYNNYDFSFKNCAALEYSFLPYSEALSKKIKLSYYFCQMYNDYHEETIYYKTKESLSNHGLVMTLDFKRKWGDFYTSLEYYNYLKYPSRNLLKFTTLMSFNLGRGFSVSTSYNYSHDNSNINISRAGLSDQDILLKTKELKNRYSSQTFLNIKYRFGSVYNNSVNTLFK